MRITITIDTDTNDVKLDVPVKSEVDVPVKPEVPKYQPLPKDYYTPTSNKPFITAKFADHELY
jgi:hypothetical protein